MPQNKQKTKQKLSYIQLMPRNLSSISGNYMAWNNSHLPWSLGLSPQLKSLSLPDCWIKDFFMAHMYTELQMIKEALQKYQNLIEAGFSKSTYIISQIAVAYHNIRGLFLTFLKKNFACQRNVMWTGFNLQHSVSVHFRY